MVIDEESIKNIQLYDNMVQSERAYKNEIKNIIVYMKKKRKINILKCYKRIKMYDFGVNGEKLRCDLVIIITALVVTQKWQIG